MRTHSQIIIALLFAGLAASCTAKLEEASDNKAKVSEKEVTITASMEGKESKTVLSNGGASVLWTPGDAISLFYGSGTEGGSQFTSTATEPSAVTNFTGTIGVITGGADIAPEDTYFWGLYPYSPTASCDGSTVTMTLSSEQVAMPGTFAPGASPSIGRSQGLSMGFYNIGGGVKFSVTKEGVRKVTLRSNDGTAIAGTARVGFDESGIPEVREIVSGTDEITLTCPTGEYFEVGEFYYMMMFPTTFNTGFTLTLETYTEEATVVKNSTIKIGRAYFGRMTDVDASATYTRKTGNIEVEDATFKNYLITFYDKNGDHEISYEEADEITSLFYSGSTNAVYSYAITSLRGIETMSNLKELGAFRGQNLREIDLSNNPALEVLVCYQYKQITSLNLSRNNGLKVLVCQHCTLLNNLDLSHNTELTKLVCNYSISIKSLDLSQCTKLENLSCDGVGLRTLDVSMCTLLKSLSCWENRLGSLDVTHCPELTYLNCENNGLESLNVSNNAALESLDCAGNNITSLDVTNNKELTYLNCYSYDSENTLESLDLSKNEKLKELNCSNHWQLKSLDLSNNPALEILECYGNKLTELNLSNNHLLKELNCEGGQLTSLDVSNCSSLEKLMCYDNNLSALDVSDCSLLIELNCSSNQLTGLNGLNSTTMEKLSCAGNQLTGLDISKTPALTELYCSSNQLTILDVSKNSFLSVLRCSPMNDSLGNNLLEVLYIADGQSIPNVTENRNASYVPDATSILVKPGSGGSEGYGEGDI